MVIDDFDEVGEVERRTMLDIEPMIAEDCGGMDWLTKVLLFSTIKELIILVKLAYLRMIRSRSISP